MGQSSGAFQLISTSNATRNGINKCLAEKKWEPTHQIEWPRIRRLISSFNLYDI